MSTPPPAPTELAERIRPVIIRADARALPLADDSVDLIVTSPPYYGLRSYQDAGEHYDGQIGAESSPAEYVAALIDCTREWMRVLRPSGSLWVNLGDSYYSGKGAPGRTTVDPKNAGRTARRAGMSPLDASGLGLPRKSLVGLPWRYALRCIDDLGLTLRAEVVWSKPNGLPESVTDRVRRSHEQWFHLTLGPRYYSAVDEIREPASGYFRPNTADRGLRGAANNRPRAMADTCNPLGKLPGSVWEVASQPLAVPDHISHARCCGGLKQEACADGVDHFAAFPMEWPRRLIRGWSPREVCTACGEGRRPVVASVALDMSRPQARRAHVLAERAGLTEEHFAALLSVGVSDTGRGAATQTGTGKNTVDVYALAAEAREALGGYAREYLLRRPTGFVHRCGCADSDAPSTPGVVLDPFGGTGTTALVATMLGRTGITVDASGDYCRLAQWRCSDPGERAKAAQVDKPPVEAPGQADLFGTAS